jgi:hypothetical protein
MARKTIGRVGVDRVARLFTIANGLIPFLALQMYCQSLIRVGALPTITLPGATAALAVCSAGAGGP